MADEEYSNSMYKNNPPMTTFEEGYDSEEEFLDNTQFEDPADYVDTVDDDGTNEGINLTIIPSLFYLLALIWVM